jgi:hypothetical protein
MKRIIMVFAYVAVVTIALHFMTGCSEDTTGTNGENPPGTPHNPLPADGATAQDTIPTMSWQCSDPDGDNLNFTVYIQPQGGSEESYTSPDMTLELEDTLEALTEYTWRVVARDAEHSTPGPDWTFTTCAASELPPELPSDPFPPDLSTQQPTNVTLSWTCIDHNLGDTLTYDVYFGLDSPPPLASAGQTTTEYDPDPLEPDTTYYWKITATDESDQSTSSSIWSFTTESSSSGDGAFAILVVGRSLTYFFDFLTKIDIITARFDSAYAPCEPLHALHPTSVSCDGYTLEWEGGTGQYVYSQMIPSPEFLVPGESYTFNIEASLEVPSLTKSIDFPLCGPYVTSPANYADVSRTGFTVSWEGHSCGSQVRLVIIASSGDTTGVDIMTENDGSYELTEQQLSSISGPQSNCAIIMILQNSDSIEAPGYDPRSYIWGRTINTTIINFCD